MDKDTQVSITVIKRLPKYYRYLGDLLKKGINRISSQELSNLTGFTASQIRQDLNNFGGFGQQGYGYNVEDLQTQLGKILGLDKEYNAVIVGAGNIGYAIAYYRGFSDSGFNMVALFDDNPKRIGTKYKETEVQDVKDLKDYLKNNKVDIGIISTHKDMAQKTADILVEGGVKGIWNFATTDLVLPEDVVLENVRLTESLFTLSYFLKENK
ncbi:MAG: redox-sensing transcriptional repressor Rex [Tissierellia bacterium]|jgi:redox-sensing transcriptional repressor|nr:redox-sensing transcriptional repressor Rex [Tissierellia bacterium]